MEQTPPQFPEMQMQPQGLPPAPEPGVEGFTEGDLMQPQEQIEQVEQAEQEQQPAEEESEESEESSE
jgi:hypothetical protein